MIDSIKLWFFELLTRQPTGTPTTLSGFFITMLAAINYYQLIGIIMGMIGARIEYKKYKLNREKFAHQKQLDEREYNGL